jgi:tetratricopeptide (TPR) repeat protein
MPLHGLAEILQKLGQAEEAEVAYRRLIESNPDKIGNYKAMLKARGLDLGTPLAP